MLRSPGHARDSDIPLQATAGASHVLLSVFNIQSRSLSYMYYRIVPNTMKRLPYHLVSGNVKDFYVIYDYYFIAKGHQVEIR